MKEVHITLLGKENLPLYYPIIEFNSEEVYVLGSRQNLAVAHNLKKVLEEKGLLCKVYCDIDAFDIKSIISKCEEIHGKIGNDCNVTYNITGGTKIMAIGAYIVAKQHKARIIYTDSVSCIDLDTYSSVPLNGKVDNKTIFKLQGQSLKSYNAYTYDKQTHVTASKIKKFIESNRNLFKYLHNLYKAFALPSYYEYGQYVYDSTSTHICIRTTDKILLEIEHPEVRMQFTIDIKNYKIGLLKIAYEFAADRIEGYIDDPIAKLYASILHEGNPDRLDEVFFEGDAINNASLNIMESIIDNSNTNRHILLLANIHNKLYCIVKLFDKFCQMIRMSDSSYGEDGLVLLAINDFVNHKCDFYSPTDLIRVTNYSEFTTFKLNDEDQAYLDSLLRINKEGIGFACNKDQDNILFDSKGIPICTESILLLTLERLNLIKEESHTSGKISATYKIPLGYYYLCMPDKKLLMVKEITKVNEFIKI